MTKFLSTHRVYDPITSIVRSTYSRLIVFEKSIYLDFTLFVPFEIHGSALTTPSVLNYRSEGIVVVNLLNRVTGWRM